MSMKEWMMSLQPGDRVEIFGGTGGNRIGTVTRVTPTQLLIGTRRFRRKSGDEVSASKWWRQYLRPLTPATERAIVCREAREFLQRYDWRSLSDDHVLIMREHLQSLKSQGQP